jgi:hypothetical protein
MAKNSVHAIALTSFNSASLTSSYQAINASGFEKAIFFLRIVNDSSVNITISYDGVTDHEFIVDGSVFELATQTNGQPGAQVALFSVGTVVYVKGTAGTGTITVSGYYV